jgi:hypothetical protein
MLSDMFVLMLPDVIGHPIILRHARQRAADLTDMQSGRLRHDFEERIKKSVHDFRQEMQKRLQLTIAGIEAAIEKGRTLRQKSGNETMMRRTDLGVSLKKIETLEAQLRNPA